MNITIDLKKQSVVELKALAFDVMIQIEGSQKTLQTINAEINKRKLEAQNTPVKK